MTKALPWPQGLAAITLFVEALAEAKTFYQQAFGLPVHFEGDTSAVFKFGDTLINLLQIDQADELIHPAQVAPQHIGHRAVYTLPVENVDATYAELKAKGVTFLNGPMDRPWGIRTASFQDPAGHIWEIAH